MRRNSRRGGAIAGIILTILMLGVLGIMALTATGLYIARHTVVTENDTRHEATIETPFGTVHVRDSHADPRQMGVPIYPGAVRLNHCRNLASFHLDIGDLHKGFAVSTAEYRTPDSVERVTEYYRSELPHWLISQRDNGGLHLSFTKHGYKKIVAISEEDGETRIALASVGEPASN